MRRMHSPGWERGGGSVNESAGPIRYGKRQQTEPIAASSLAFCTLQVHAFLKSLATEGAVNLSLSA